MRGFSVLHLFLHLFFYCTCCPSTIKALSPENQNQHSGSSNPAADHTTKHETRHLRRQHDPDSLPLIPRLLEEDSRRTILQTRTTLLNVDVDDLTPEEIIFFEDTWVQAFNQVLLGENDTIHDNSSSPRLRSFVVEEVREGNTPNEGRSLASTGGRTRGRTTPSKWFDIWALLEASCRLCSHDDYRGRILTGLTREEGASTLQDLETTLCEALQGGPFSSFHDLQQCRIVYLDE